MALDALDAGAIAVLGPVAMFGHRYDECFDRLHESIAKNPNLASACEFLAAAHGCRGELDETLAAYDRAIVLSPADPTRSLWMSGKRSALLLERQYEAALENAALMLRFAPDYGPAHRQHVSVLSHLGRGHEAKAALDVVLDLMPHLTVSRLAKMVPVVGPENAEHWLNGLRMAGLPE